jgi:penicillin-binding protein 2
MKKIFIALILIIRCITVGAQILPSDGSLTIDDEMQKLSERLLEGKQGSIVAIEPTTGEIKCMASASFMNDSINRAISEVYSPGSTFKTAQALTFLTEGILNKDKRYSCYKGFWLKNIHIGCHKHRSPQNLIGAISNSCNSYFCKAFMDMIDSRACYKSRHDAVNVWHEYMLSMGLGKPLGVDLPGEKGGLIPDAAYLDRTHHGRWNAQTIMWMGMGQGEVQVTPIQLCNLAASISNRGFYFIPHIHQGTEQKPLDAKFTNKIVTLANENGYNVVREGMRLAMVSGTAKNQNSKTYQIYGKTGTAENIGNDHSIFIGFASLKDRKIAIAVFIENGGFGADIAAPMASLLIEQYLTRKLSARSQKKVDQWQDFTVLPSDAPDDFEEVKE